MRALVFPVLCCIFFVAVLFPSCKHDSMFNVEPDPTDTTGTGGNNGGGSGVPCDPDSVYFNNQILPILISNCTQSGCHNDQDREEGIVLSSYQSLISTVENATLPNWDENDLLKVLIEVDLDKRMPYGKPPLPQAQIDLIGRWVAQGAKNNACNENTGPCNTANTTFSSFVQPLIQSRCQGCHSGSSPQGGLSLASYTDIKTIANNGQLYTVVTRSSNWMPKGGQKLDDCTTSKLKAWIDAGALNN
jgi:hypothetical protein